MDMRSIEDEALAYVSAMREQQRLESYASGGAISQALAKFLDNRATLEAWRGDARLSSRDSAMMLWAMHWKDEEPERRLRDPDSL